MFFDILTELASVMIISIVLVKDKSEGTFGKAFRQMAVILTRRVLFHSKMVKNRYALSNNYWMLHAIKKMP